MLSSKKEVGFDRKEEQSDVGNDPDEEDMEDVKLYDERMCHWRMVFEDNDEGVDNNKAFLHAKKWDVYVN